MPRVEGETLQDPIHVYLASSLGLARAVEAVLTSSGVDYAVEVQPLGRTTLFGSLRHGAAFYVSASQADYCRSLLKTGEFAQGVVEAEQPQGE
jgi:hypothetical protein